MNNGFFRFKFFNFSLLQASVAIITFGIKYKNIQHSKIQQCLPEGNPIRETLASPDFKTSNPSPFSPPFLLGSNNSDCKNT